MFKTTIKRLRPPTNPVDSPTPSSPPAPPATRILHPSNTVNDKDVEEIKPKEPVVWITWKDGLVDSHLVLLNEGGIIETKSGVTGVDGVYDWDLVSVR